MKPNFQRLIFAGEFQKISIEFRRGFVIHGAYSRFFRWFMNSSLVLKVLAKPASACLMLLLTPSSNSLRAASFGSWMTAFSFAPAMMVTPRCWAIRIAKRQMLLPTSPGIIHLLQIDFQREITVLISRQALDPL
jgi:hypothetical protein